MRKAATGIIIAFFLLPIGEERWPPGYCARLRSERSGFELWPGTLCYVFGQDT